MSLRERLAIGPSSYSATPAVPAWPPTATRIPSGVPGELGSKAQPLTRIEPGPGLAARSSEPIGSSSVTVEPGTAPPPTVAAST